MTEYVLQKKTLGGWSYVTWYDDLEQAKRNYDAVTKGDTGYSWRLVKLETLYEKLLEDLTPVTAPELNAEAVKRKNEWSGDKSQYENEAAKPDPKPGWGSSWGPTVQPAPDGAKSEHGLAGKVWLVNHQLKEKRRVDQSEVEAMMAQGWIKGGPRTVL